MNAATLPVGIAICDTHYTWVTYSPTSGQLRKSEGALLPYRPQAECSGKPSNPVATAIEENILPMLGCSPSTIAIAHHDVPAVHAVKSVCGHDIVALSPTVATLAGLQGYSDRHSTLLQAAPVKRALPAALLKIGPHRVSWAADGDTTPTLVEPWVIASASRTAKAFMAHVGTPRIFDPIELLGNPGWLNAAKFLRDRNTDPASNPTLLTRQLMQQAVDQPGYRMFASHICSQAMKGNPFAIKVVRFMVHLFGTVLKHVAAQGDFSRLYVQYNSISAVSGSVPGTGMPDWVMKNTALASYFPPELNIHLMGFRPQIPEALGAMQIAARRLMMVEETEEHLLVSASA